MRVGRGNRKQHCHQKLNILRQEYLFIFFNKKSVTENLPSIELPKKQRLKDFCNCSFKSHGKNFLKNRSLILFAFSVLHFLRRMIKE